MGEYIKAVFILMSGILGLCVGSFLNVVIYRIPEGLSLSYPPSHCPSCNYKLKWYDNIPVLSYLMLGGKCRGCRGHISFRYTAVEILNTLLWILSAYIYRENMPYGIISMIMISVFVSVFFIDLERGIIPDRFHIIIAVASIAALFFDKSTGILSHFIGLLASGAIFISLSPCSCMKRNPASSSLSSSSPRATGSLPSSVLNAFTVSASHANAAPPHNGADTRR